MRAVLGSFEFLSVREMCSTSRLIRALVVAQFVLILVLVFRQHDLEVELKSQSVKQDTLHSSTAANVHRGHNTSIPYKVATSDVQLLTSLQNGKVDLLPKSEQTILKSHTTTFSTGIGCPSIVAKKYGTAAGGGKNADVLFCKSMQLNHGVQIGRSWGGLGGKDRLKWEDLKCNELIIFGALQSCDQRYGWKFIDEWRKKLVPVVTGLSNVSCASNPKQSTFCKYQDVTLDFTKMQTGTGTRAFGATFLTGVGQVSQAARPIPLIGTYVRSGLSETEARNDMHKRCDIIETRPTFVLSNDDNFNLGHYYNDLMGVWGMLQLSQVDSQRAVLLNIDGWRESGPAGVDKHRLMVPGSPDEHGPFVAIYNSWFAEVQKARDFPGKRVCYTELYFPPMPGVPWFWNDWGRVNECSEQAASPLYQSYNLFMRGKWSKKYGALPNPPTDKVHVVIEVRAIDKAKRNNQSAARHIANLAALVEALQSIPNVVVTAQNFALIPFEQQVALAHSAGVFVSMHGAGTTHIFHSALGQPNCCALVELFPDESVGSVVYNAKGYGNIARMLGMHHYSNYAEKGATSADGTTVNITSIASLVTLAATTLQSRPTCLHSVK